MDLLPNISMIFNQFSFAFASSFSYSSDPHLTDYLEGEFLDEQVMECFLSEIIYLFILLLGEINQGIRRLYYQLETCWYWSWRIHF